MSMITEKRQEIIAKINDLETIRNNSIETKLSIYRLNIEDKVKAYHESLMTGYADYCEKVRLAEPYSPEYEQLKKVLNAIDEVIAYETKTEIVKEADVVKVEEVDEVPETLPLVDEVVIDVNPVTAEAKIVEPANHEARPGMVYVGIPEGR